MSRLVHITLTNEQHAWLTQESERTSVSLAELVRRAIDQTFAVGRRPILPTHELTVKFWSRRNGGRRSGLPM